MKIVFFGTSEFAVASLKALVGSRHKVVTLVTQPDRKKGRLLKVVPPPAKVFAIAHDIDVHQPPVASSPDSVAHLKSLGADLFVVVSFGQILKRDLLAVPKLFAVNVHASLLPKYRGAAPTNRAIMNGETVTGVTIMRMSDRLDEGDIILLRECAIGPDDTNILVSEALAELGARALLEAVDLIEGGKAVFEPQDGTRATYAPKLTKEEGLIDWSASGRLIHDKVRGLLPWPGAYTRCDGEALKILRTELSAEPAPASAAAGEIVDIARGKGLIVKTGSGLIVVTHLQREGKNALDADAFLRGYSVQRGAILR